MTDRFDTQLASFCVTGTKIALVAFAGSALILSGCSKKDNAKSATAEAGKVFRTVAIGDSAHSDGFSKQAYTQADQATADYAGSDGPYGESAAVASSLAKLGLATLTSKEASEAETSAMHQSRVIRGHLSEWISMNAVAKSTTNLDISEEKASLTDLIELRKNDVEQYTQRYESLRAEIDAYQAQIDDLDSKAMSERNESARFELQMTSVSATQAAQLAERVREHSLRADGYELESVRVQGLVGQLLPGAHEVELQVQKAKDQIELLQLSIDELEQRVRDSKADSAQARANAESAQSAIKQLVEQLEEYRSAEVIPANERVISGMRQAIRSAGGANDNAKLSGAVAKASGQEQLARAISRQARGEAEMVLLYESIKASGLPGQWDNAIESHTTRRDELMDEAKQSFQDAASSLRRVRVRGSGADAIEAAAVRLDRLGGIEPEPEYQEEYEEDAEFDDSEYDDENQTDLETEDLDDEG